MSQLTEDQKRQEAILKSSTAAAKSGAATAGLMEKSIGVQKGMHTQLKIANAQLAALNITNADIAASNRRIESIQRDALDQTKRQTAIMELQLEEAKLAKLEKTRQIQLKQGAFSLNKDIDTVLTYPMMPRLLLLNRKTEEANQVNLNADELHEIADKEYTHTVINRLQSSVQEAENGITAAEKQQVAGFLAAIEILSTAPLQIEEIQAEISKTKSKLGEKQKVLKQFRESYGVIGVLLFIVFGLVAGVIGLAIISPHWIWGLTLGFVGLILIVTGISNRKPSSKRINSAEDEVKAIEQNLAKLVSQQSALQSQFESSKQLVDGICIQYPDLKVLSDGIAWPTTATASYINQSGEVDARQENVLSATRAANAQLEVLNLATAGKKFEAIKKHQETTGCGLAEAKEFVEKISKS